MHEVNHGSVHEGVILKDQLSAFCYYRSDTEMV